MAKFLDLNGLGTFWGKIKDYVAQQGSSGLLGILGVKVNGTEVTPGLDHKVDLQLNQSDINNDDHTVKDANYNNFSTAEKNKLSGIAAGAEVNVITGVVGAGLVTATKNGKAVTVSVNTDLSQYNNTTSDFASKSIVDEKIAAALTSAIIPKGTVPFNGLPNPAAEYLGYMYNVANAFVVNNKFVEYDPTKEVQNSYPAGTNVYVVKVGEGTSATYLYDVMAGMTDLSSYWTNAGSTSASNYLTPITDTEIGNITDGDLGRQQTGGGDEQI